MPLSSESLLSIALSIGAVSAAYLVGTFFILPVFSSKAKYLNTQTWVGVRKQSFARLRASVNLLFTCRDVLVEGYEKFNRNGKFWVLPQFCVEDLVMLPADKLQEIVNLPKTILDPYPPNSNWTAPKYTYGTDVNYGPHFDVVRRQLTRRLPLLTSDVCEELGFGMENVWKPTNEWKTVKAYETCMKIISRAANRVFCGTELCRNPEFLESTRLFSMTAFMAGLQTRLIPTWLHPIFGRLAAIPNQRVLAKCRRIATPVIQERLENLLNPELAKDEEAPVDALQWILEMTVERARTDPKELDIDLAVRRLMMLNLLAIHTTSIVTTNVILDLYTQPDADMYVEGLREEVERVLKEHNGVWTKDAINKLIRVDSVIRETMRVTPIADYSMKRLVNTPEGITFTDGSHIPHGITIGFANYNIQTDPDFYPENPKSWNGFRFSAPREGKGNDETKSDRAKVLEQKNQNLTATAPEFLSFGHGKHACPGRFFASQEMKLSLAMVVMRYDVRVVGERPRNDTFGGMSAPSGRAEFQIRLRQT